MGIEEKLPSGVLLTTVEGVAGYFRKASFWPATFGLACCAIEMMTSGGPKYDLARFGMEVFRASPRQADLMIVAGRVSQKMAPVLRQIYDQMAEPKWVLAMGVCASSGGMFNNYAIVQGVDHVVPGRHVPPGLPAATRDAHRRDPQAPRPGADRQARRQPPRPDRGARDHRPGRAAHVVHAGSAALSDEEKKDPAVPEVPVAAVPTDHSPTNRQDQVQESPAREDHVNAPADLLAPGSTEERAVGARRGMFGASGQRRHQRVRRPGRAHRLPRRDPAPLRRLVRRGGRRPRGAAEGDRPDARDRAGRGAPRRDHLPRAPRGPALRRPDAARRRAAALRVLLRRQRRATTPTTRAASCTRSTTCSR